MAEFPFGRAAAAVGSISMLGAAIALLHWPTQAIAQVTEAHCKANVRDLRIQAVTLGKDPEPYVLANLEAACKALGHPKPEETPIPRLPDGVPGQITTIEGSWAYESGQLVEAGHVVYDLLGARITCYGNCDDRVSPVFPNDRKFCKILGYEGAATGPATLVIRPEAMRTFATEDGNHRAPVSLRVIAKGARGAGVDVDKVRVRTVPGSYSTAVRRTLGCWEGGKDDIILSLKDPTYVPPQPPRSTAIPFGGLTPHLQKSGRNAYVTVPNNTGTARRFSYRLCRYDSRDRRWEEHAVRDNFVVPNGSSNFEGFHHWDATDWRIYYRVPIRAC